MLMFDERVCFLIIVVSERVKREIVEKIPNAYISNMSAEKSSINAKFFEKMNKKLFIN